MAKKTAAKKKASAAKTGKAGAGKSDKSGKSGKATKKAGTAKAGAKKKVGAKKKAGAKGKASKQPYMTASGKGATTAELGKKLVEMFNAHTPEREIWSQFFHKNFESIEGDGQTWSGVKSVGKKCDDWMAVNTIHDAKASGPFVGATGFSVLYEIDVECKQSNQRMKFSEVGVYTVKNGKVVREEFMFGGM